MVLSPLPVLREREKSDHQSEHRQAAVITAADIDKDGRVTALDLSAVRAAMSRSLTALAAPPPAAAAPAASPASTFSSALVAASARRQQTPGT